jgi:uncharacterized protein YaaR (DUF327 family)
MGIFVNPNNIFEIEVYFNEKFINEIPVGIVILEKENPKCSKILCQAKGRDFETMSKILEDATILNSVNGSPMLRISIFYKLIIRNFIKEIYILEDTNKTKVNITSESINNLNYDIVKSIAKKWMKITGG